VGIDYIRDLFLAALATGPHVPVKWSENGDEFTRDELVMGHHIPLYLSILIPRKYIYTQYTRSVTINTITSSALADYS
jgi:hypothetical protein